MIDFVLEHIQSFVMAGMIAGLWTIARNRRKAVDRLVNRIEHCSAPAAAFRRKLKHEIRDQGEFWGTIKQDAPGRVIARSVRRMTKEKP